MGTPFDPLNVQQNLTLIMECVTDFAGSFTENVEVPENKEMSN